jgi:hypothetical protein
MPSNTIQLCGLLIQRRLYINGGLQTDYVLEKPEPRVWSCAKLSANSGFWKAIKLGTCDNDWQVIT